MLFKIKAKWCQFEEVGTSSQQKGILLHVLSFFIIHQDLPFRGFALKIESAIFVYELFIYEIIYFITWLCNVNRIKEIKL